MGTYRLNFPVQYEHRILFSEEVFTKNSESLRALISIASTTKFLVIIEDSLNVCWPTLANEINQFCQNLPDQNEVNFMEIVGAENAKKDLSVVQEIWDEIELRHIDRHSYVFAIGGGAFLDVVGLATATAHRGIRLVRFPTTTLSQDDSGVGVKNGVNAYGKKNFIGTFAVPYAVVNDARFLFSQPKRHLKAGLVEAIKVALVKDGEFFHWMYKNCESISKVEKGVFLEAVERSAMVHAKHITEGGDPFELGNNRPLDFGHWSAHKLEQISNFEISHAEAVAMGVAWDVLYSAEMGWLAQDEAEQVIDLIVNGLEADLYHPLLHAEDGGRLLVFKGLDEFREHLGGELTLSMLKAIGVGFDVHDLNEEVALKCLNDLQQRALLSVQVEV